MSFPLVEVAARRRLAGACRRMLVLVVPAAIAACQGAGDAMAPESSEPTGEVAVPATETVAPALLASNKIAYLSFLSSGESNLWTMGAAGGSQTQLTSFTGNEIHAVWSPDHKRVAFERKRNGLTDIFLVNADGTNKHWARSTAGNYPVTMPSWAPDGSHLLVSMWLNNHPFVAKLDLATGGLVLIAPVGVLGVEGRYPIYAADGKAIYYIAIAASQTELRKFTPGGADAHVRSYYSSYVNDLALSPDGKTLAYSRVVGTSDYLPSYEICVLNLSLMEESVITWAKGTDSHPAWSPDGTKLAFTSYRTGKAQIYTMGKAGANVVKITNKTYGAADPSWYR